VIRGKPVLPALFAAACLALAAAPSAAALFGDDVARKGVAEQQKRIDGLAARYDELATRLAQLEDAVKAQAAQTSAATQPVLDLANQLQVLREELRGMRGQLEVLSNGIEAAARRQRDMYVDLDTRLRRFEQAPPAPAPTPGAAAPAPGPAPAPGASAPPIAAAAAAAASAPPAVDETRTYEAAQNQRRIGNYQAAVVAFQTFVTHYPRSPLAHRAQYWVGDSYYNLRDYKNAIANQQKLISTYPESASVPDALLNMASAYIELGDSATARKTMDKLVARYPSSDAAEKARRRLTALR
jgi:tol-pal system protein YbgF